MFYKITPPPLITFIPRIGLFLQRSDLLCLRSDRLWEVTSICVFKPSSILALGCLGCRGAGIAPARGDGLPAVGIHFALTESTVFFIVFFTCRTYNLYINKDDLRCVFVEHSSICQSIFTTTNSTNL